MMQERERERGKGKSQIDGSGESQADGSSPEGNLPNLDPKEGGSRRDVSGNKMKQIDFLTSFTRWKVGLRGMHRAEGRCET